MKTSIRTIAFTMAGAFALAGGAVAGTFSVTRAATLEDARVAVERARTAEADYQDATYGFAETLDRAAGLEEYPQVLSRLGGGVDATALERARQALDAVADIRRTKAATERVPAPTADIPRFRNDLGLDDARAVLEAAEQLADEWSDAFRRVSTTERYVSTVLDDAELRLVAMQESAPAAAGSLVGGHVSATQESRGAALTTAAAAASAVGDARVAAFVAYADAVDGLRASHAAEQARVAAEAEAAARASSSRPPSRPSGGGGRAPSGGGGTGSGGGSGSTGGGGTSAPVDTKRYVDPRGQYTPGCALGGEYYRADPGPGGTSIIASVPHPYDYRMEGTWVVVYICSW